MVLAADATWSLAAIGRGISRMASPRAVIPSIPRSRHGTMDGPTNASRGRRMAGSQPRGNSEAAPRGSAARKSAVLLALRYYGRELARRRWVAVPGLLLPALGNTFLNNVSTLFV